VRNAVTVLIVSFTLAVGCATPAPEARWQGEETVELPLASSRPPTVKVTIEGEKTARAARLMLDTGAEEAALDERLADELALESTWRLNAVEGFDEAQGGVGRKTVFQREARAVYVGEACRLSGLRVLPLAMPQDRDGAIGLAAFPGRALVLDPVRRCVSFVPRARVDALAAREGVLAIPVRRQGNLLLAKVHLRDAKGAHEIEAVLDTGASDSFLNDEALGGPVHEDARFQVRLGAVDAGGHSFRVEHGGSFCTIGGDVLLGLGRPLLFDLEGERVLLLPPV